REQDPRVGALPRPGDQLRAGRVSRDFVMQRILLVTDNTKTIAPLQQELLLAGYHAQTAAGRHDALLEALSPKPPDILVLNGSDASCALKEVRQILHTHFPTNDTLVML